MLKYLNTDATEDDWKVTYDQFLTTPSMYTCAGKPCDFHDTVLLGNLAETSFSYNFDCAKECPAVDERTKIPCSGHGRCGISGSCICDPAKVIRGTDAATGSTFKINVFGGENYESNEFLVSKLDQTGWRGEDCSLQCPGYDLERQDMTEVCSGHGVVTWTQFVSVILGIRVNCVNLLVQTLKKETRTFAQGTEHAV